MTAMRARPASCRWTTVRVIDHPLLAPAPLHRHNYQHVLGSDLNCSESRVWAAGPSSASSQSRIAHGERLLRTCGGALQFCRSAEGSRRASERERDLRCVMEAPEDTASFS